MKTSFKSDIPRDRSRTFYLIKAVKILHAVVGLLCELKQSMQDSIIESSNYVIDAFENNIYWHVSSSHNTFYLIRSSIVNKITDQHSKNASGSLIFCTWIGRRRSWKILILYMILGSFDVKTNRARQSEIWSSHTLISSHNTINESQKKDTDNLFFDSIIKMNVLMDDSS